MEVSRHRSELPSAAAITFAPPALIGAYARELGREGVALYADTDRSAYAAFGFGRASVRRVWLDPRVWARYAGLLARGRRPRPVGQDTLQLGGDVLLDSDGTVAWVRRSEGPEDRPSVAELVREARSLT